ncbi:dipeptidase E [Phyllobacterium trifolii]|uniref:Dipeptidase E n=1 Tax=Phyllobacterium trifolii TaxID=300193 RepID=A0A839UMC4_9HYPH|nr:Type 1 glutamine amidotransferase-like domain-containing protein [Phyllobacterium trifolii]MBB3149741.1 dipeptidase E [Phyllobacterium trifolii]
MSGKPITAQYDIDLSIFYDLDEVHSRSEVDDLLACDAIHLSGGDTVAFLNRMKRSGMLVVLRDWAENGGILIGTSAGAILMTPTIAVDALFSGQHPEEVLEGGALDLLSFEFFPHLDADPKFLPALLRYSKQTPRTIIGCSDGEGVVVAEGNIECVGKPMWISNGEVVPAQTTEI